MSSAKEQSFDIKDQRVQVRFQANFYNIFNKRTCSRSRLERLKRPSKIVCLDCHRLRTPGACWNFSRAYSSK
jgi:hypothetical protein